MRNLKVKFDKQLTTAIRDLALRHRTTTGQIVHSAVSLLKLISDADVARLSADPEAEPIALSLEGQSASEFAAKVKRRIANVMKARWAGKKKAGGFPEETVPGIQVEPEQETRDQEREKDA